MLDPEYSRWRLGQQQATGRDSWVAGIADWFKDGWRVAERTDTTLAIEIAGEFAFARRIVTETFASPDGTRGEPATAALAETWKRHEGSWRLFRVEIVVLD